MDRDGLMRFLEGKHKELGFCVSEARGAYRSVMRELGTFEIFYRDKKDNLTYEKIKGTLAEANRVAAEMYREVRNYGDEHGISRELEFLQMFEPNIRSAYDTAMDILKHDRTGERARFYRNQVPERLQKESERCEDPYSRADELGKTTVKWLDRPSLISFVQSSYGMR